MAGDFSAASLGLAAMAMYGKRGPNGSAAVLDAPATERARETQWPVPEPAPAGTLQRRAALAQRDEAASRDLEDSSYTARRESFGHRFRSSLLRTVAGRILGASVLTMALAASVLGAVELRRSLLHDPRFAIESSSEIQISGNRHLTRAQVLSVFGADLERNIFKIPLAERRANVERLPWVEHATVERLLPNALRIVVTERIPIAFVRQGSQIGLVDAGGVLLDMPPDVAGDPHYSFPVLTGLAESDPLPVRAARMAVYRRFMRDLDSTGEKITQSLSEVDVSNPEDVKAVVTNGEGDVLVHFGDENFLQRYRMFAQNLPQWKSQYPKLASVDTRYENEFVLEMQPGSTVPLAGDAPTAELDSADAVAKRKAETKPHKTEPPVRIAAESVKKPAVPVVKNSAAAVGKRPPVNASAKPQIRPAAAKKPILVHAYSPNDPAQVNP